MMRCGGVLILALFAVRVAAETLTVATYNVENYLVTDRMADGVYRKEYPKPESEKRALRAVIASLGADVLAIEEMGGSPFLAELQRDLATEGCKYPYAELLEAADPDRHVAVLSKRPFTAVQKHTDLSFTYFGAVEKVKRGLLEVRFSTEIGEVTLFVVHLKSRFTERDDDLNSAKRRASEAEAVRDRVLKTFPEPSSERFLIVGDFNDNAGSRPLRAMIKKGKTAIAALLPAADSRGEVWTHFYKKEETYTAVDHILVSDALKNYIPAKSAIICDRVEVAAASDHRPILVKLDLHR